MDKKKNLIDVVTQSGWWRMQRASRGEASEAQDSTPLAKKLKSTGDQETGEEESTLTGVFRKLNFF